MPVLAQEHKGCRLPIADLHHQALLCNRNLALLDADKIARGLELKLW
jgi:hypothetical protein